jgi:hypothetical protein
MAPIYAGHRYVVEEIDRDCVDSETREPGAGVKLRGLTCRENWNGKEFWYCITRFRPIDDGDAAIFREMIKIKHREPAHV